MQNETSVGHVNETQENLGQITGAEVIYELHKAPSIPAAGRNLGRFTNTELLDRKLRDEEPQRILRVSVTLDAMDDDEKPFVLSRDYNLSGNGLTAFRAEIKAWRGWALTREELAKFNATKILLNKPVAVEIAHREIGNKTTAHVKSFNPVTPVVVAS